MVHLRAQDFDRFSLESILKYWWQWPDGTLSHPDAGDASFDLLTIYDSVWKSNRVEVFGHDFEVFGPKFQGVGPCFQLLGGLMPGPRFVQSLVQDFLELHYISLTRPLL